MKSLAVHDLNFLLDVREARGGAEEKGEIAKIYLKILKSSRQTKRHGKKDCR